MPWGQARVGWGGLNSGLHDGPPLADGGRGGAQDSPLPVLVRRDQGGWGLGQRREAQPCNQGPARPW